jgi:four helix bundle protein
MLRTFKAYQFAKEFHWSCKSLRISRFLQDQLLRASSSVALNLAEGSGKRTSPEQRRFYSIALGSLRECQAILELERISDPKLLKLADQLGAILFALCRKTENQTQTETETATETKTESKPSRNPDLFTDSHPRKKARTPQGSPGPSIILP